MTTRRQFLTTSTSTAAALLGIATRPAAAKEPRPTRGHPIGVSTYSFWQFRRDERRDIETCITVAAEMGFDGVEIMIGNAYGVQLWEELVKRGAKPCGLGARDTLRLEASMPLYGHELNEDIDPFQAGLSWAVKMDKGDFRGKASLEKRQKDATTVSYTHLTLPTNREV